VGRNAYAWVAKLFWEANLFFGKPTCFWEADLRGEPPDTGRWLCLTVPRATGDRPNVREAPHT